MNNKKVKILKKLMVCLVLFALVALVFPVNAISAPTIGDITASSTVAGSSCMLTVTVTDDVALHPNGTFQFGTNNTGPWVWDDAVSFTSTPQTIVKTLILNATVGTVVSFMWNFTNNENVTVSSGVRSFTLTASSTITQYSYAPTPSLLWFLILVCALIVGAIVAYKWMPILGLGLGIVGVIGSAFFYNAGTLEISRYVDPATNITTITLMPVGLYIVAPIVLCVLNMVIPLVKRKS